MRRVAAAALVLLLALPAAAAELRPFEADSRAAIAAVRAGRPHVVAVWSVHCLPCVAELPMWRRMVETHGLDLVLIATDPLEDEAARIAWLLRRHGLDSVEIWAFADPFVERLRHAIDPAWRGELPRSYFVAADGTTETISGAVDAAKLRAWLDRQRR